MSHSRNPYNFAHNFDQSLGSRSEHNYYLSSGSVHNLSLNPISVDNDLPSSSLPHNQRWPSTSGQTNGLFAQSNHGMSPRPLPAYTPTNRSNGMPFPPPHRPIQSYHQYRDQYQARASRFGMQDLAQALPDDVESYDSTYMDNHNSYRFEYDLDQLSRSRSAQNMPWALSSEQLPTFAPTFASHQPSMRRLYTQNPLPSGSTPEQYLPPGSTPKQYLPSVSTPKQYLPPGSTAAQYLPSVSTPKQYLPPGSTPRQYLPSVSTPKQYLPPGSTPKQYVPPGSAAEQCLPPGSTPEHYLPPDSIPEQYLPHDSTPDQYLLSDSTLVQLKPSSSRSDSNISPPERAQIQRTKLSLVVDARTLLQKLEFIEHLNDILTQEYGPITIVIPWIILHILGRKEFSDNKASRYAISYILSRLKSDTGLVGESLFDARIKKFKDKYFDPRIKPSLPRSRCKSYTIKDAYHYYMSILNCYESWKRQNSDEWVMILTKDENLIEHCIKNNCDHTSTDDFYEKINIVDQYETYDREKKPLPIRGANILLLIVDTSTWIHDRHRVLEAMLHKVYPRHSCVKIHVPNAVIDELNNLANENSENKTSRTVSQRAEKVIAEIKYQRKKDAKKIVLEEEEQTRLFNTYIHDLIFTDSCDYSLLNACIYWKKKAPNYEVFLLTGDKNLACKSMFIGVPAIDPVEKGTIHSLDYLMGYTCDH